MVEIQPFRAMRYNPEFSGDVSLNVCPPFDVITPQLQHELYGRSRYNIVRLELARRGLAKDPYEKAAETAEKWVHSGVLTHENVPSIYVTEEEFIFQGEKLFRRGFVAAVRLEDYDQKVVLPHEGTRSEWVADRVNLMRAAQSNYSPLLSIFRDDLRSSVGNLLRAIAGAEPTTVFTPPDMPQLRVWRVSDPGTIKVFQDTLKDSEVFIADGHHRYEAALRYRGSVRAEREVDHLESINYRMMLMVSFDEPGLITRGYHRLVESATKEEFVSILNSIDMACDLEEWFPKQSIRKSTQDQLEEFSLSLGHRTNEEVVFGLMWKEPGKFHIARMKKPPPANNALEKSEYSYLHSHIIGDVIPDEREEAIVSPHHDSGLIARQIESGQARMAFIMRPVPLDEFVSIVTRGWRLPPKATNFYPKPLAGAVIQTFGPSL